MGPTPVSTVHWLAQHEAVRGQDDLQRSAYAWNDRRTQFTDRQLRLAYERLAAEGWIRDPADPAALEGTSEGPVQ